MKSKIDTSKIFNVLTFISIITFLYYISTLNYLIFHTFSELISIGISLIIFIVVYNSKEIISNNYLKIMGLSYFFISILDVLHTLSYEGMILFKPGHYYANQLWIGTRFFEAIVMFFGFYLINKKNTKLLDPKLLLILYAIYTGILIASIFPWDTFPECYIQGVGQTRFKIYSEYLISIIFAANLFLLFKKRSYFPSKILKFLSISFIFYIATELTFTVYISNYGFSNLLGHYFKIIAFYFSYKALVETAIKEPYQTIFKELSEKKLLLEEMNKTKDKIFSIIGHDLRDPISSIQLSLELTKIKLDSNKLEEAKDVLTLAKKSTVTVLDILEKLLSLGRLQSNILNLNIQEFSIEDLFKENEALFSHIANQKNIIISFEKFTDNPPKAFADKFMITTVLRNLINNSIKFTPKGGEIKVFTNVTKENITISVADNGVGIKEENINKIFELGSGISTYGTEHEKGVGLGLVLCREFIQKNHGNIWVESTYGNGSSFHFTIPKYNVE